MAKNINCSLSDNNTIGEYLDYYCENENKRIKKISNTIILKHFAWLPQKYYDDFYSIAGEVLWNCCERYKKDQGAQFETYLIGCLTRKFKTRITYMNRQRRNGGVQDVSLDSLIENKDICLMNLIASDSKVESDTYSEKMISYLKRLSTIQKQILFLMSEGFDGTEIQTKLKITEKDYFNALNGIRAYRNVSILF